MTTRTGLIPTPKKTFKIYKRRKGQHECLPAFEAAPIALSLRPLGGIYNPFARGCSVLCNHPAPAAVKDVIHQMKVSMTTEIKQQKDKIDFLEQNETDNIPEDLFRRYTTDTDSRPLTPTPTVTSVHTRTSAGSFLNNRRCITPELGKNEIIKRKKIILDLRRTHSQETLYWKPSSDLTQSTTDVEMIKAKSVDVIEVKKTKRQKSDEHKTKTPVVITTTEVLGSDNTKKTVIQTCINEQTLDDENVRRGKKRKKSKVPTTATFHLSEDPETQMATLGPDSVNPSTRPSLIPNVPNLLPDKEKRDSEPVLLKGSFLTDEVFQVLKTELDIDLIENTFERYLNRALREAIKYVPQKPKSMPKLTEDMETLSITKSKMPRKLSKSATRFEIPLNLKLFESMSVLDYLSEYVWLSRQRKQLYKRIFVNYLKQNIEECDENEKKEDEKIAQNSRDATPEQQTLNEGVLTTPSEFVYVERTISMLNLPQALEDVLEFYGTEQNIAEILRLLDFEKYKEHEINFRTWCGIVAFGERLAVLDATCTDSCDELEKVDFSTMEECIDAFNVPDKLREVLNIIRTTHCIVNNN